MPCTNSIRYLLNLAHKKTMHRLLFTAIFFDTTRVAAIIASGYLLILQQALST